MKYWLVCIGCFFISRVLGQVEQPTRFPQKENVKHIIETGVALATNVGYAGISPGYFLNYIYGYRVNPIFSAGANVGIRKYTKVPTYQSYDDLLLPISVQVRIYPLQKKHSPFIASSFGGSFAPENNFNWVGTFWNVLVGGKFQFSKKIGISLAAGYENQGMKVTEQDPYIDWTGTAYIRKHAILYQVGIQF